MRKVLVNQGRDETLDLLRDEAVVEWSGVVPHIATIRAFPLASRQLMAENLVLMVYQSGPPLLNESFAIFNELLALDTCTNRHQRRLPGNAGEVALGACTATEEGRLPRS